MPALHGPLVIEHSGAVLSPVFAHTRAQIVSQQLRRSTKRNLAFSTPSDLRPVVRKLLGGCIARITQQEIANASCLSGVPQRPAAPVQRRHLLQHLLLAATASAVSGVGECAHMLATVAKCLSNLYVLFAAQPAQADLIRDLVKGYVRPVRLVCQTCM